MDLNTLFLESLQAGSLMTIGLAFVAGIASSFLGCTLMMLPVMVGYVGAYSEDSKWSVLRQVLLFIMGLATVMTLIGVLAALAGQAFGAFSSAWLYYAIGGLCLLAGLQLFGAIHLPLPSLITQLPDTQAGKLLTPYLLGGAFGLVASPCGTPVLAAILGVIAQKQDVGLGAVSLFFYAVGQGIILLIVGLCTGLLKHKALMLRVGAVMTKIAASVIVIAGIIFILQGAGLWNELLVWLNLG
jgi:cytochrome c-type biogenesis protein